MKKLLQTRLYKELTSYLSFRIKLNYLLLPVIFLINNTYNVKAQKYSTADKATIFANVDTVLKTYMSTSALGYSDSAKINSKVINEYKSLFMPGAKVFDEINPQFHEGATDFPYWNETKSVGDFTHDMAISYTQKPVITHKRIGINYDSVEAGVIRVALQRSLDGITNKRFNFLNEDTLLLKFTVLPDNNVKIAGITAIGSHLTIKNDQDNDGVIDEEDKCKTEPGKIDLQGCPDSDGDGIANWEDDCKDQFGTVENRGCPSGFFAYSKVFSGFAGYQFNGNFLSMPELDKLDYQYQGRNAVDKDQSKQGKLSSPDLFASGSPVIGANLAYYFGKSKKRNKGISLGFTYARYTGTYKITDEAVYTFKTTDGVNEYRRRITIHEGSQEKITFNMINIPLLLHWKALFGTKWAGEFSAGPSFILFANSSEFSDNISFEGLYQTDPNDPDGFTYDPTYTNGASTNVEITGNELNNQSLNPGANSHIALLDASGYDFELNKQYNGSSSKVSRSGFALDVNLDGLYQVRPKIAIKIGISAVLAPLTDKQNSYSPINARSDNYNSIYNSKPKTTYFSYGANIGFILGLR